MKWVKSSKTRLLVVALLIVSCRDQENVRSSTKGFSSSSSAKNEALLMTAYGHTPGYRDMFERDLENMKAIVTDPTGNYAFHTETVSNAGQSQMIAAIAKAAQAVSPDGTFFLYITAHGATSGQIEPAGQQYATFGFPQVLQGIRQGRAGMPPFKRLFIFISACYSGSWLSKIGPDPSYSEYIAMTSVDAYSLSTIGNATAAMKRGFTSAKKNPTITMQGFLQASLQNDPGIQYEAQPQSLWYEPLINSGTPTTPDNSQGIALAARVIDGSVAGKTQLQLSVPAGTAIPTLCLKRTTDVGCVANDQMIALVQAQTQSIAGRLILQTQIDLPDLNPSAKNLFNVVIQSQNKKFALTGR